MSKMSYEERTVASKFFFWTHIAITFGVGLFLGWLLL